MVLAPPVMLVDQSIAATAEAVAPAKPGRDHFIAA
jgi:hypothetical protein